MLKKSTGTLESLHVEIPSLKVPVESLPSSQRQAVAILRAEAWDAKLVIMGEPTNNLGAGTKEGFGIE